MRKSSILYFIIFLLIPVFGLGNNLKKEKPDSIKRYNEIGLVITDLVDASYQFRYERKLSSHFSVGLGSAFKSDQGLVKISGIDKERLKTGDITYSGLKLIPDVRYYLNKTQQFELDGFYFGAYMKYFNFRSDLTGTYITREGKEYDLDFDARINIVSTGLMLGYKLAVSKRFNIDFMILGPGTSNQSYKLKNNKPVPDEFYDDLNEALKNFSLYDLVNSDFKFRVRDAKTSFTTLSFRYGLTVGYTF
ncbi:DUF3575 domain-containing protein [Maribellus sediminis]|uniref:DUF3575 domain-containing protein n=1 Tax=Maribellus sediminis TaxID=2696285 RepID=UPI0014308203|nr:DUF3575 domain-containing protein [Maribellus sediminis]